MGHIAGPIADNRPLTRAETDLIRWMLEHGRSEALAFRKQLESAAVVSRCPCGCASLDFSIAGQLAPSGPLEILGDYLFGGANDLAGAFVFARGGVLAGLEVYGLAGDHPRELPAPESLRPFAQG